MAGKHRSMDGAGREPRPYCLECKKFFRNWRAGYKHVAKDEYATHHLATKMTDEK